MTKAVCKSAPCERRDDSSFYLRLLYVCFFFRPPQIPPSSAFLAHTSVGAKRRDGGEACAMRCNGGGCLRAGPKLVLSSLLLFRRLHAPKCLQNVSSSNLGANANGCSTKKPSSFGKKSGLISLPTLFDLTTDDRERRKI